MIITDLLTLTDYFEQLANSTDGINHFLPLSNGLKAIDEIEGYYTNDYVDGATAFFQVAETPRSNNGAGADFLKFMCSITVAEKPTDKSARAGLVTRDRTMKLILQFLGKLDIAMQESQEEIEELGTGYEFRIEPSERIFPIGLLANVDLDGHYLEIDVTIPANHLLFP
jgi:hypothetical protein